MSSTTSEVANGVAGSVDPILRVTGLTARYGPIAAVRGVSFEVGEREVVTLLGANGAGKSTTLNALMGLVHHSTGEVWLRGKSIQGKTPEDIVNLGMGLVPERRRLFTSLTVEENLRLGASSRRGRIDYDASTERVLRLFPVLERRYKSAARTLSGGEQQMLAIGRALMAKPSVLLLDEPSLGLAPKVVEQLFSLIGELRDQGVTCLVVEQNVAAALELADRGYVLQTGRVVQSGSATDLFGGGDILASYLGAAEVASEASKEPPER
jgi:branched-chain amino acid transport system ATP-binding protein